MIKYQLAFVTGLRGQLYATENMRDHFQHQVNSKTTLTLPVRNVVFFYNGLSRCCHLI